MVAREVAARGTISAAAEAVALSQPAVTQAIAALERSVAAPLFERNNRGVMPTPSGAQFLACAERALAHLHDALADLLRVTAPDSPRQVRRLERSVTCTQLHALMWIVEHGGFSEAARAAGVSPPTLHRAARELERLVGLPLLERTSFGVRPTREAERLARGAQLAFAALEQGRAQLLAADAGETGRTVICSMPLARTFLLPRALIEFTNTHPEHSVAILEGPYDSLVAEVRAGVADLLIGALRQSLPYKDLVQELLFEDDIAIIMRAGHPLARHRRVSMDTLAKYSWITPRCESPAQAASDDLFRAAGLEVPASTIECESLDAARALLIESDRLMLLSRHQVHYDLRAGLLAELAHPLGRITRQIGLTFRVGWQPSRTQQRLLEILRRQANQLALRPEIATPAAQRPPATVALTGNSVVPHPRLQHVRTAPAPVAAEEPLAVARIP